MKSLRAWVIVLIAGVSLVAVPAGAQTAQQIDRCVNSGNSTLDLRINSCTILIQSGKYSGKDLANAFTSRGVAYASKKDFDRAIADYTDAIRIDPNNLGAYNSRGFAYDNKRDFDHAISDLDQAIRLAPKLAAAYINRSIAYSGKSEFNKALQDLDEADRLSPGNALVLSARGFAFKQRGDLDFAIRDLSEAIRLSPNSAGAYSNRGDAYRQKGEIDRAIADLNEAIRLEPKLTPAFTARALAYEQKGDPGRAKADFKKALSLPAGTYLTGNWAHEKARERLLALGPKTSPVAQTSVSAQHLNPSAHGLPVAAVPPPPAISEAAALNAPDFKRRVAFVVGNGNYRYAPQLLNPTNDAKDFAQTLRKLGFDVVEGTNLDRHGMDDAIRQFGRKLDGADLALFFYAGHGLQVGGKNYLVPVDAKLERSADLVLDAVDVSLVLAQMEAEKRVNLVFLDACRDNPLARSLARTANARSVSIGTGLASIQSAIGTMIVYATQPDNVALDGESRNSPFTTALLKHISTPGVDIGTLMRRVRADVVAATHEKQVPWDHSSLMGEVVLAR